MQREQIIKAVMVQFIPNAANDGQLSTVHSQTLANHIDPDQKI